MKPTVTTEVISPKKAAEYLTKVDPVHQRRLMPNKVEHYARMMRAGHWGYSHQGIAFDVEGRLIDGQHRLQAAIVANISITVQVTRGLPVIAENGLHTIDLIDRGAARTVGQQLTLRHGLANGVLIAGVLNSIVGCYLNPHYKIEATTGSDIYDLLKGDIDRVVEMTSFTRGLRVASIIGTAVFCRSAFKSELDEFYEPLMTGENLKKGMAALTMRNYALNATSSGGSGVISRNRDALCQCMMHHVLHNPITVVKTSNAGYQFFLKKQPSMVRKIRDIMGIKEDGK